MEQSKESKTQLDIVERYSRTKPAASQGVSFGLLKNNFLNAIEYKGIADGIRGLILFWGIFCLIFVSWTIGYGVYSICRSSHWSEYLPVAIYSTAAIPFGIYFFLKSIRLELFRPQDEPIIFDRKNRKVYRIFREVAPGWKGLLKSWPLKTASYNWDLIDAEHHAAVVANTSTISRIHSLVFIVRQSANDPVIEDGFTIGNGQLGEVAVPAVYEHIRKFMEDNGPHVPPSEIISPTVYPSTIWQCLASVGPYGDNFKTLWNDHKIWLAIIIIFYPILFFIMTPIGIFSWLSYKTAIPISWPQEVIDAVGEPTEFTKSKTAT